MDVFLEAGSSIEIIMSQTGEDYVHSPAVVGQYSIDWSEATLTLPIVYRTCDNLFQVPIHSYNDTATRTC